MFKIYLDQVGASEVLLGFPGILFRAIPLPGKVILDFAVLTIKRKNILQCLSGKRDYKYV